MGTGLASCGGSPPVQPAVAEFGTATLTAQSAEGAFFAALNQKQTDLNNIHVLASERVAVQPDGSVRVSSDNDPLPASAVPADVMNAIDQVMKTIQAYGQAMLALSGDTAASTFDTNVDNLAKQAVALDAATLVPLVGSKAISSDQQTAVAQAVKDIGNIVINSLITRDVKAAAKNAQTPLTQIVGVLKDINSNIWSKDVPINYSRQIAGAAVARWNDTKRPPSYEERVALKATWEKAATPLTATAANNALDALVKANSAIAANGPLLSKTDIESFAQTASDAYKAYKALLAN